MKRLCALGVLLLLSGCGGGGGGGGGGSGGVSVVTPTPAPALTNFTTITVDAGPAALNVGADGYTADNVAYVSVKLCAPGSATNCQTIDHVQVDTGSVGLRVVQSVLSPTLLAALPLQTDPQANPVGECYQYVGGYAFGSVRHADFSIGGEAVANMPLQVAGDTGAFAGVPSQCSSGGGGNLNTVPTFGANGILGIGSESTDCGSTCTAPGGYGAAIYFDCPSTGCATVIVRASSTAAPFQQLPNPVAAFPVDNNGTILSLPSVPAGGESIATGTLYFGIGTQTNNALGTATVLPLTTSTSARGSGILTAVYKSQSLADSYIDSGSDEYFFVDASIAQCSQAGYAGYYCPASALTLSATLSGTSGPGVALNFPLYNAASLFSNASYNAFAGLGGDPSAFPNAYPSSFAFGLPFFYGRNVYTAIEGRSAGAVQGPFVAF